MPSEQEELKLTVSLVDNASFILKWPELFASFGAGT
jgi:hypothetical protein